MIKRSPPRLSLYEVVKVPAALGQGSENLLQYEMPMPAGAGSLLRLYLTEWAPGACGGCEPLRDGSFKHGVIHPATIRLIPEDMPRTCLGRRPMGVPFLE